MTVTMRSEAYGKQVGETYTGPEEAWLLAEGYAFQTGYEGIGVSNTGATDVAPAADPQLAVNREDPLQNDDEAATPDYTPAPYDFDAGGVDTEQNTVSSVTPATGLIGGGTVVTIKGLNLGDVTGVTFGGTAGTALVKKNRQELTVTTPAHAAGAVDVVVTDPQGATTKTGAFTYTAS